MLPHLHVFGLTLPTFGVMMLCGVVAAFVLMHFVRRHIDMTEDDFYSAAIWAIVSGMLGSKITYWIVEFDRVIADPHFLLETLTAGFVFYGSLIGGALGVLIFALHKKQNVLVYVDLFSPAMALGQAFGRIGCFCAGCCYGAPSSCSLAVTYPAGVGSAAPAGVPLLPTQLFESAFCFVLTAVLVWIFKRQKRLGTTTSWYFILYGVWRFIIEFFRSDDRGAVGSLSTSQFLGIFIVLVGLLLLLLVKRGKTPLHPAPGTADAVEAAKAADKAETTEDVPAPDAETSEQASVQTDTSAEDAPSKDTDADAPEA